VTKTLITETFSSANRRAQT